jgi:DnaK suppressor protein
MSADLAGISVPSTAGRNTVQRSTASQGRHLHPSALPQWRALLELRWQRKLEQVTELSLAYYSAEEVAADISLTRPERKAARREANKIRRRTVAQRQALANVEAALSRVATGRYGWCEGCSQAITVAQLTAEPERRYCPPCAHPSPFLAIVP